MQGYNLSTVSQGSLRDEVEAAAEGLANQAEGRLVMCMGVRLIADTVEGLQQLLELVLERAEQPDCLGSGDPEAPFRVPLFTTDVEKTT